MNTHQDEDVILDMLATLSPAAPTANCDERIRSQCHRLLAQRGPAPPFPPPVLTRTDRLFDATLALAAAIYGAAVLIEGLRLIPLLSR